MESRNYRGCAWCDAAAGAQGRKKQVPGDLAQACSVFFHSLQKRWTEMSNVCESMGDADTLMDTHGVMQLLELKAEGKGRCMKRVHVSNVSRV